MRRGNLGMLLALIVVGLTLSACARVAADAQKKEQPARVEAVEGSSYKRIRLTQKAAERLDVQVAPVRTEDVVRKRRVGGVVRALAPEPAAASTSSSRSGAGSRPGGDRGPDAIWVRVPLTESELDAVDGTQAARVLPLTGAAGAAGWIAQPIDAPIAESSEEASAALHYALEGPEHGLRPGQRVFVEIALKSSGSPRKVIPYTAVIYDLAGETWAYTSPEPLVFVRHPISVDYVGGDLAVLSDGPPSGAAVVTVGAAELYGTEFGVGK